MGWKIFIIAISNAANISTTDVQNDLGLDSLKPTNEVSLANAQFGRKTCIGKYQDNIFIVNEDLIFKFSEKEPSDIEKKLIKRFPNSEVTILIYNSTVDLFGYTIIKNGRRVRVKSGADMQTYIDSGEKLPEEMEASKEKLTDKEELKEMQKSYSKEQIDTYLDQQIGIRTVFKLTKRFLNGKQIDDKDSPGDKIMVTTYE